MGKAKNVEDVVDEAGLLMLGVRARDMVSGWTGVLTARYEYLNGCTRYEVSGSEDGKPKGYVFDEAQLEVLVGPRLVISRTQRDSATMLERVDPTAPSTSGRLGDSGPRTGGDQSIEPVAR